MAYKLELGTHLLNQTEHDGKLANVPSISTSCRMNERCVARMKDGCAVCHQCFAQSLLGIRRQLELVMTENWRILNARPYSRNEIPFIHWTRKKLAGNPNKFVRIESFGDVSSVTQAKNYLAIIRKNKTCHFGVWTKNLDIWAEAMKRGKPSNMTLVFSSLKLNEPQPIPEQYRKYVDHRFTVFTKEYAAEHNIPTNCAAESCAKCGRCYRKSAKDFDIYELLRTKRKEN